MKRAVPCPWRVLVDPAVGLNRFGVMDDWDGAPLRRFEAELTFAQNFRRTSDGVTFETLFTGYSDQPLRDSEDWDDEVEHNLYRASGTLGIALRRYQEGQGYTPALLPEKEHYSASTTSWARCAGAWRGGTWPLASSFVSVRGNPNTGETRGASVYVDINWLLNAELPGPRHFTGGPRGAHRGTPGPVGDGAARDG
ncbi:hypothetical protein [Archangium lipolyticum]|uniref:hypothetical protein n=1 Tax=Archangium lipolyticum TaxID=2970465 RepID=UPI002149F3F4|nr:hypothetical protein [Archangium lipolyticum]